MALRRGDRWRANSPPCSGNTHTTTKEILSSEVRQYCKLALSTSALIKYVLNTSNTGVTSTFTPSPDGFTNKSLDQNIRWSMNSVRAVTVYLCT